MTPDERQAALDGIAGEIRACRRCRLAEGRTNAVPGEGHPDTEVVLVGEGPGQNEDLQGRPFVGAAGGFLEELLGVIGWSRREVFITNVVKCRPPGNRDPEPDEIAACAPFLRRQLAVLDPALVVTLGRFSMQTFIPGARIGQAHGTVHPVDPATGPADAVAFAMYHPAAAFRQGSLRETMKVDMLAVPTALQRSREGRAERGHDHLSLPAAAGALPGTTTMTADPAVARIPSEVDAALLDEALGAAPLPPEDRDQMGLFR